ncbi:MAG: hypothetical protein U0575_01690 [Phycisphaerales bacterium]
MPGDRRWWASGTRTSSGAASLAVLPYDQDSRFPAYLLSSAESNGKFVTLDGDASRETGPIGANRAPTQHAFYQLIHQHAARSLRSSLPARTTCRRGRRGPSRPADRERPRPVEALAQRTADEVRAEGTPAEIVPHRVFEGKSAEHDLPADELDPRTLGALIALYEHKVFVQGTIWQINSFDQWGVEFPARSSRRGSSRNCAGNPRRKARASRCTIFVDPRDRVVPAEVSGDPRRVAWPQARRRGAARPPLHMIRPFRPPSIATPP